MIRAWFRCRAERVFLARNGWGDGVDRTVIATCRRWRWHRGLHEGDFVGGAAVSWL